MNFAELSGDMLLNPEEMLMLKAGAGENSGVGCIAGVCARDIELGKKACTKAVCRSGLDLAGSGTEIGSDGGNGPIP